MVKIWGYDIVEAFEDIFFRGKAIRKNVTEKEKKLVRIFISLLWLNAISMIILYFMGFKTIVWVLLALQIVFAWTMQGLRRKVKSRIK